MTPLIHLRVVLDLIDAIRPGRNHYRSATGLQLGAQLVAVVGFVGNQGLELDAIKQGSNANQIVTLASAASTNSTKLPSASTITLIFVQLGYLASDGKLWLRVPQLPQRRVGGAVRWCSR